MAEATGNPSTPSAHHALTRTLSLAEARAVWTWVADGGEPPGDLPGGLRWLHATFDDGLVWGELRSGRWVTGVDFGTLVAELRAEALWELRLFGLDGEVLLWADDLDRGSLAGRVLADGAEAGPATPIGTRPVTASSGRGVTTTATSPIDELRLLLGDRLIPHGANSDGFSLVGDATGARQVVPLPVAADAFQSGTWWPLRLAVRHYLGSDPSTAALQVTATRFVDVGIEDAPGDQP